MHRAVSILREYDGAGASCRENDLVVFVVCAIKQAHAVLLIVDPGPKALARAIQHDPLPEPGRCLSVDSLALATGAGKGARRRPQAEDRCER